MNKKRRKGQNNKQEKRLYKWKKYINIFFMYSIMKVISFDVGIKNLAYCLFDIPNNVSSENKIKIVDWKVLSLMGEEPEPIRCNYLCCTKKNEKGQKGQKTEKTGDKTGQQICNHLAKYSHTEEHLCYNLCEKHAKILAKENKYLLPDPRFKSLKKMKLEELVETAVSFGYSSPENSKAKKPKVLAWVEEYLSKKCLIPVHKKTNKAGEADLISLGHSMKKIFKDTLSDDISCVLIENQISTLASRMKTVQGMLAQYFIMRYDRIKVEFISSANKLKMFSKDKEKVNQKNTNKKTTNTGSDVGEDTVNEEIVNTEDKTDAQKYKEHKKDGVFYCEKVLNDKTFLGGEQWKQTERKKKDDLADCFLQGVWWLHKEYPTITSS